MEVPFFMREQIRIQDERDCTTLLSQSCRRRQTPTANTRGDMLMGLPRQAIVAPTADPHLRTGPCRVVPPRSFSDLPPHLLSCLPLSSRIYWPGASVILATQRGYAQGAYPLWETPVGPSGMYMRRLRLRKQNNKQQTTK